MVIYEFGGDVVFRLCDNFYRFELLKCGDYRFIYLCVEWVLFSGYCELEWI